MANSDGETTDHLIEELAANPYAFDFYAAVRLLQSRFPNQPRLGYSKVPADDPIRFAQNPALNFAPSTLEPLVRKEGRPPIFYSRHFGLFGPHGPLPLCLTEYARERMRNHGDATFTAFCNIFHHRLLSFFFRSWADAQKTVDLDRPDDQHWADFVGSLIGLGMDSLQRQDGLPDRAKLYYAGRLVQHVRNAEGLEAILQDFFGIQTEVHTFVGRWLKVPGDSVCKLGASPATGLLGSSAIVGSKVWNCQMHFRLRMGPMKLADFERLLPTGASFKRLCDWIRLYVGDEFTWDAQLVLAKEEVPAIQFGKVGKLGWTTWLKTKPFETDSADLILQPHEN